VNLTPYLLFESDAGLAPGSVNQIFVFQAGGTPKRTLNGTLVQFNAVTAPVTLHLVDGNTCTAIGNPVTLTPEPATICLLGLGGLLLRKRKVA
jgi:hypothetical protein